MVEEIHDADRKGQLSTFITYQECLQLEYLLVSSSKLILHTKAYVSRQAIMKEAMRVHPGVGFPLERLVPAGGTTLVGKYLPAGTIVSMSAPVMHCNTDIFGKDAHEFRPERWLESGPEQIKIMDRSLLTVRT